MARNLVAVVAGLIVVGVVVAGLQSISTSLYPLPEGVDAFDPLDAAAFTEYLEGLPFTAWLLAGGAEIIGAFLGALTAGRIAASHRKIVAGLIVVLAALGSVYNWVSFAHPTGFMVAQGVAYPLVFFVVQRLLRDDS